MPKDFILYALFGGHFFTQWFRYARGWYLTSLIFKGKHKNFT